MIELIFLGTGGGRIVVFQGIRKSGGVLIRKGRATILVDPGPGALNGILKEKIYPNKLSALWLTHKDLDHTGEVNILIEGMTEGGFKKRGKVFAPSEVFKDGIILEYLKKYIEEIEEIKPLNTYKIEDIVIKTSPYHLHRDVECMGFIIENINLGYVVDTLPREDILGFYKGVDTLVLHTVLLSPKKGVYHISIEDVPFVFEVIKPKKLILTHFGMRVLMYGVQKIKRELEDRFKIPVLMAYDGMKMRFDEK